MAITIFLALNGLAVAFLLYVLANFWKEGRRSKNNPRSNASEKEWRDWAEVAVITHPISSAAHGGLSVIPFAAPDREFVGKQFGRHGSRAASGILTRRISAR